MRHPGAHASVANVDAIAFYRKIGFVHNFFSVRLSLLIMHRFETDDTSPLYDEPDGVEGVDYDIMSLEL